MATENKLPTNDPDLILAQTMGVALELGSSFKEINDSLIDQLNLWCIKNVKCLPLPIPI
jgi:hypothetical protein